MKYIYYIPDAELIYVGENKYPAGVLNKLRRDMYKYLIYATQHPRNIKFICTLLDNGGISNMKFIMSDSIPFLTRNNIEFFSYKNNDRIKDWIIKHPGQKVIPITTIEEYDSATVNRHQWDELSDMYP